MEGEKEGSNWLFCSGVERTSKTPWRQPNVTIAKNVLYLVGMCIIIIIIIIDDD